MIFIGGLFMRNIPVHGRIDPSLVLRDVTRMIKDYENVLSAEELKWRIGLRLAQEELLWRNYNGMDEETKEEISFYLEKKSGRRYTRDYLKECLSFYLNHLNLFTGLSATKNNHAYNKV